MPLLLNIETTTNVCSVALSEGSTVTWLEECVRINSHSEVINSQIESCFHNTSYTYKDLNAVAISSGPGSYTGLRIGLSTAKGLCYALNIPLISISTLKAMTWGLLNSGVYPDHQLYCPMIDARRMEVYTAIYDSTLNELLKPQPVVLDPTCTVSEFMNTNILVFGNGAEKTKNIFKSDLISYITSFNCSSTNLPQLAYDKYKNGQFENNAYFEPDYLKEFYSGTLKKKVI